MPAAARALSPNLVTQKIPDDWNIAVIVPCYKKGDKAKSSNYRGISFIAIVLKVLEAVIKNRLDAGHMKAARINQAGFKKGVGCRDQVFTLRQILEQRYQFSRLTVLIFIDFKAAFDSVNREAICTIPSNLGFDPIIINILRTMQAKTTSKVRVNNTLSREFEIANGVRQGSIIAPFLFNLAIDWIMQNALCQGLHGISPNDTYVLDLDFAYDICLLEDNAEDAQHLLDSVVHAAENVGFKINASKTKFCSIDPTSISTARANNWRG